MLEMHIEVSTPAAAVSNERTQNTSVKIVADSLYLYHLYSRLEINHPPFLKCLWLIAFTNTRHFSRAMGKVVKTRLDRELHKRTATEQ